MVGDEPDRPGVIAIPPLIHVAFFLVGLGTGPCLAFPALTAEATRADSRAGWGGSVWPGRCPGAVYAHARV